MITFDGFYIESWPALSVFRVWFYGLQDFFTLDIKKCVKILETLFKVDFQKNNKLTILSTNIIINYTHLINCH